MHDGPLESKCTFWNFEARFCFGDTTRQKLPRFQRDLSKGVCSIGSFLFFCCRVPVNLLTNIFLDLFFLFCWQKFS